MLLLFKTLIKVILISSILFDIICNVTVLKKRNRIYYYGGIDKKDPLKEIQYLELDKGFKVHYQKVDLNILHKYEDKDFPKVSDVDGFDLGEDSDEILNFGGSKFLFNRINLETFKVKNETKGIEELAKFVELPKGLSFYDLSKTYNLIQNNLDKTKFALFNLHVFNPTTRINVKKVLVYDAKLMEWEDRKINFYYSGTIEMFYYKNKAYGLTVNSEKLTSYKFDLDNSKFTEFSTTGQKPPKADSTIFTVEGNQLYWFPFIGKENSKKVYILNLDTFVWKAIKVEGLANVINSKVVYYNGYLIFTGGDFKNEYRFTQIINTKTWQKEEELKPLYNSTKVEEDEKELEKIENDKSPEENNDLNIPALIGGLVGGTIFVVLIAVGSLYFLYRYRKSKEIQPPDYIDVRKVAELDQVINDKKPLEFRLSTHSEYLPEMIDWNSDLPPKVYSNGNMS